VKNDGKTIKTGSNNNVNNSNKDEEENDEVNTDYMNKLINPNFQRSGKKSNTCYVQTPQKNQHFIRATLHKINNLEIKIIFFSGIRVTQFKLQRVFLKFI